MDLYGSLKFVSGYMGNVDFTKYALDTLARQVEFPTVNSFQSNFDEMKETIAGEDLNIGNLHARYFNTTRKDEFLGRRHAT